ncbi:MAG TPA: cytochrome c maturation protein CcmE [Acidimicrobiales bacterium]|nr:cytochrome c maturation protein CcmE [Acidimicrobiales bacterium]
MTALIPREVAPARRRRWLPVVLVAVIGVAIIALFANALGSASLFFKNVDEAVRDREALGTKRFQVQGTVVDGSIARTELDRASAVRFTIAFKGVEADVVHTGDTLTAFKAGATVVLEGKWLQGSPPPAGGDAVITCAADDGWYIATDRMYNKHDSDYSTKNADRIDEAEAGGAHRPCLTTPVGT